MTEHIIIKPYTTEHPEYKIGLSLREKYLRKPLNKVFTPEELITDTKGVHFIGFTEGKIIGCVTGNRDNHQVKIRQMLVIPEYRNLGVGSLLLNYLENYFQTLGVSYFYLHSRQESINFYLKNSYKIVGKIFLELDIPHQKAEKIINLNLRQES